MLYIINSVVLTVLLHYSVWMRSSHYGKCFTTHWVPHTISDRPLCVKALIHGSFWPSVQLFNCGGWLPASHLTRTHTYIFISCTLLTINNQHSCKNSLCFPLLSSLNVLALCQSWKITHTHSIWACNVLFETLAIKYKKNKKSLVLSFRVYELLWLMMCWRW